MAIERVSAARRLAILVASILSAMASFMVTAGTVAVNASACIFGPQNTGPERCDGALATTDLPGVTAVAGAAAPPLIGTQLDVIANANGGFDPGHFYGDVSYFMSTRSFVSDETNRYTFEADVFYSASDQDMFTVIGDGPIVLLVSPVIYATFSGYGQAQAGGSVSFSGTVVGNGTFGWNQPGRMIVGAGQLLVNEHFGASIVESGPVFGQQPPPFSDFGQAFGDIDFGGSAHLFIDVLTPGASIVAASGHDYSTPQAVPEPSEWVLMLAGFGLGALVRRRKGDQLKKRLRLAQIGQLA